MIYPHIKMPDTTTPVNYILNPYSQKLSGEWYRDYYTCYQNECVPYKWNPGSIIPAPHPDVTHISICKFIAEESKQRILRMRYPEFRFHWNERNQHTVDTRNT